MKNFEKGDVNLLLFFLVSALFLFFMATLWSKNWLMDVDGGNSVFLSKAALDRKVNEKRLRRENAVKKTIETNSNNTNKIIN